MWKALFYSQNNKLKSVCDCNFLCRNSMEVFRRLKIAMRWEANEESKTGEPIINGILSRLQPIRDPLSKYISQNTINPDFWAQDNICDLLAAAFFLSHCQV